MIQGIANVEALTRNVAHVREQRPQNGSGGGSELSGRSGGSRHHRCESEAVAKVPESIIRLRQEDIDNLTTAIGYDLADNTRKNYLGQWRRFCAWALNRAISPLPADPELVAAYLDERFLQLAHRPATLYAAAAAIAFIHRTAELDDPCDTPQVKCTLRCATRKAGSLQRQAEALTAEALLKIRAAACQPRRGRGGKFESPETARRRGMADIAIIHLMRDAMLRVSEAAALSWADIETQDDGSGRLLIRRSKTDAAGEGVVVFLSSHTMDALELYTRRRGRLGQPLWTARQPDFETHQAGCAGCRSWRWLQRTLTADWDGVRLGEGGNGVAQPDDGGTLEFAADAGALHSQRDRRPRCGGAILQRLSTGALKRVGGAEYSCFDTSQQDSVRLGVQSVQRTDWENTAGHKACITALIHAFTY